MNNTMNDWHNLCITDKTGVQHFKCTASPMSTMSEIRNLQRHLDAAKRHPKAYAMLDVASAVLLLDGLRYGEPVSELDIDALLSELGVYTDDLMKEFTNK
jgi:hypothetical protein